MMRDWVFGLMFLVVVSMIPLSCYWAYKKGQATTSCIQAGGSVHSYGYMNRGRMCVIPRHDT